MIATTILTCSVLIQLFAAVMAFRLISITGRKTAWILISCALALMALRRVVPLYQILTTHDFISVNLLNETIGLLLSTLMALGIVAIAPVFMAHQKAKEELQLAHDHLETLVHERTIQLEESNKQLKQEVSDRIQAEESLKKAYLDLQNTQMQLIQSEKMATVGQLAAGVAHEINNPTGFVISNLEMLQDYLSAITNVLVKYQALEDILRMQNTEEANLLLAEMQDFKDKHNIEQILEDVPKISSESLEGMHRIAKIVKDLRSFSHSDDGKMETADIHDLIQSALNIAWNEIKYKVEVIKSYQELPKIRCFPQLLSQVFLNLFVNAAQAIEKNGTITIKTCRENGSIIIIITDTGNGIPEQIQKRVFEPFFTTKPVGRGTGLGLSIAYSIIERHKGKISLDSTPGKGTTFTISLPAAV